MTLSIGIGLTKGKGSPFPPFAKGTSYTISGTTYPSLVSQWKLNDANTASQPGNAVDSKSAFNLTGNAGASGLTTQRPSLISGLTSERSTLFSRTSSAIFYDANSRSNFDRTGLDAFSIAAFAALNVTRSGGERYEFIAAKNSGNFNAALSTCVGYLWGIVWDGTKMVLVLHQRTSSSDYLEMRGTTDLLNGRGYHFEVSKAAGKGQANVSMKINGKAETLALGPSSPAAFTGSTTNASGITLGGRGGGGGGDGFNGWLNNVAWFNVALSDADAIALAVQTKAPTP